MQVQNIFEGVNTIAIVGLSDKVDRPSHQVASYLQSKGFRIIPVNPNIIKALNETSYPDLLSIPKDIHIDIVDIFRRSDQVLPHVQEAIQRGGAKTIWMQEGVVNDQAKTLAEQHGLTVVMNCCLMKTHKHLQRV